MDRITVSANVLKTADLTIKELNNNICTVIEKYKLIIKDQFNGIDMDLQNDLSEYLDELNNLEKYIIEFESANSRAIHDRIKLITEYSMSGYKKRNLW